MKFIRWCVLIILIVLFIIFFLIGLPVQSASGDAKSPAYSGAGATTTFDHSNCQYPNRWSNPVDGCDNSDPAVPECTKAWSTEEGEKSCIDAFVKAHQEPKTVPVQQTPATTPTVSECGGK